MIPYIYRNRVWTLDDTQWPTTLENFKELDNHLSANLPRLHAKHQWQMILYFYKEIERELKEWKRIEETEREVMEAVRRVMTS